MPSAGARNSSWFSAGAALSVSDVVAEVAASYPSSTGLAQRVTAGTITLHQKPAWYGALGTVATATSPFAAQDHPPIALVVRYQA